MATADDLKKLNSARASGSQRSGFRIKLKRNEILQEASENPAAYLKKRNAAMKKIADKCDTEYQEALKKYLEAGYPLDAAEQRADEYEQKLEDILMAELEIDYPEAPTDTALNLTFNESKFAQSGFAAPKKKTTPASAKKTTKK